MSWVDANSQCDTSCYDGVTCPAGTSCFAQASLYFDHPNKSIVEVRNMIGEREDQLRKDIENDEAWLDTECDRIQQAAQAH